MFSSFCCRRFVLNDTLFTELVEASRDLPGNRWSVGGNAPVMAGRMATEGCDVLLGGSFSPDFTDVLSQQITGTHTHTLRRMCRIPLFSSQSLLSLTLFLTNPVISTAIFHMSPVSSGW